MNFVRTVGVNCYIKRVVRCARVAAGRHVNVHYATGGKTLMAYTPELSHEASCTLRRLSWSLNKPMTKTMEWIFTDLIKFIPSQAICEACRDKSKCSECSFSNERRGE